MDRIEKYFKSDCGVKSYSNYFLKFKKGYNTRKPVTFIKEPCIVQLENNILRFVEKHENRNILENISNLKEMMSYRGVRHMKCLPTRGQRTKTNARTSKKKSKNKPINTSL